MPDSITYPGSAPGVAAVSLNDELAVLENEAIRCAWEIDAGQLGSLAVENKHTGQKVLIKNGALPRVGLGEDCLLDLTVLQSAGGLSLSGDGISAAFSDDGSGLELKWSAALTDSMNAVVLSLQLTVKGDVQEVGEVLFVDAEIAGAQRVGNVSGSVVTCEHVFMAVEHPLAKNTVDQGRVECLLPQNCYLKAGDIRTYTFAIGVTPANQLRRGFSYYIDRRRAHSYRPFLHYNNWYDVRLDQPANQRITEQGCIDAIHYFGQELVWKRGVKMDAVVWDDGWDDYEKTLWEFHDGFPDGFRNLVKAAKEYGMDQGAWLSPKGGYAYAQDARIAHCTPLGYETNVSGFSMGGPKYAKAFRDACLRMMRENGVVFFKFDGMGDGGHSAGLEIKLSDDINGVLELSRALREEDEDVYISATAGTWASPYWLLYADNVWRQGGDSGHFGDGDTRQQWITFRDMKTYNHVVQDGPMYPLNSLMLHGILIGDRKGRAPAGMVLDEKSVSDEIWTFFGSGTCLQELYISPGVPTDTMLDTLAEAANWSRANSEMLIDTHWVGGSPGEREIYGWAAWQPGKGILTLRNPSDDQRTFSIAIKDALELPEGHDAPMTMKLLYAQQCKLPEGEVDVSQPIEFILQSWEAVVLEFHA